MCSFSHIRFAKVVWMKTIQTTCVAEIFAEAGQFSIVRNIIFNISRYFGAEIQLRFYSKFHIQSPVGFDIFEHKTQKR